MSKPAAKRTRMVMSGPETPVAEPEPADVLSCGKAVQSDPREMVANAPFAKSARVSEAPQPLELHRVVQVVAPVAGRMYGLLGQVGEVTADGFVWIYCIRERGAKEFLRVPIRDVAVVGVGRVSSHTPRPDGATRALIEREQGGGGEEGD